MPRLHYLTEALAEDVIASLTEQIFPGSPAFQLRGEDGRHALLSALAQPRWPHYRTLPDKAGILHYVLNKNHPFADGNKRFALTAMDWFLAMNRGVLFAGAAEAEAFALGVADGSISKDESINFVRRRAFRAHWSEERFARWLHRLPEADQVAVSREIEEPTSRFMRFVLSTTSDT